MTNKRLEKLQKRRDDIDRQIKATQAKEKQLERSKDTRRCIIAGRYAMEHSQKNPNGEFAKKLNSLLNEYVTRPADRALFGLANNDNLKDEFADQNNQETPNP